MSGRLIHTVGSAADYTDRHPNTIRLALAAGELHGTQRVTGGTWRIRQACLDSWIDGEPCDHAKKRKAA